MSTLHSSHVAVIASVLPMTTGMGVIECKLWPPKVVFSQAVKSSFPEHSVLQSEFLLVIKRIPVLALFTRQVFPEHSLLLIMEDYSVTSLV